jgi:chitinase
LCIYQYFANFRQAVRLGGSTSSAVMREVRKTSTCMMSPPVVPKVSYQPHTTCIEVSHTGFMDLGVTNFCCPPGGAQPSCGWYTQKNGNCDSTCPKDMIEIGSYNKNCKKTGTYQSACCNSNYKSMKLYTKGEWGKYPMCEETSSCPASDSKKSELLGSANAGSGQAICNAYYKGHVLPKDPPNERKFCYDGSNKKERFSDCVWYGGVGTMLPGAPKDWCLSGCPSNRVRIGLGYDKKCANFSYRALCCVPHMVDVIQIENPKLQSYRDALAEYIKNPRCEVPAPFSKRDSTLLVKREQKFPYDMTGEILLKLLTLAGGGSAMMSLMEEAWNAVMGNRYSNLHFPSLREFTQKLHTWTTRGPIELAQQIMCNLNYWNSRAAKKGTMKTLVCVDMSCDAEDCGEDIEPQRLVRRISEGQPAEPFSHGHQRHHHHHRHNIQQRSAEHDSSLSHFTLQKREERDYKVEVIDSSGTKRTITITLPSVRVERALCIIFD